MILNKGFTLVEMLVSIAIFSMISIGAYSSLNNIMLNDTQTTAYSTRLNQMQQGFRLIEQDLKQIVARGPSIVISRENNVRSDSEQLAFFRTGWLNPDNFLARGEVQKVHYVVQDRKLIRLHYLFPEPIVGEKPIETVLFDDVDKVNFGFFYNKKWDYASLTYDGIPKGVSIEIEFGKTGSIRRIFLIQDADIKKAMGKVTKSTIFEETP